MIPRILAAGYLAAQAVAVGVWWALLALWPAFRALFELGERAVLDAFLVPDVLLALASLVAARLTVSGHGTAAVATGVVLGAVACSTAMTAWHVLGRGEGWLGLLAMGAATTGTAICLILVLPRRVEPA